MQEGRSFGRAFPLKSIGRSQCTDKREHGQLSLNIAIQAICITVLHR